LTLRRRRVKVKVVGGELDRVAGEGGRVELASPQQPPGCGCCCRAAATGASGGVIQRRIVGVSDGVALDQHVTAQLQRSRRQLDAPL